MKSLILSIVLVSLGISGAVAQALSPKLEVLRWNSGQLEKIGEGQLGVAGAISFSVPEMQGQVVTSTQGALQEISVSLTNSGEEIEKLVLRVELPTGAKGGTFWDGLESHAGLSESLSAGVRRYRFPAQTYISDGKATLLGFAPQNLSSRFENACLVTDNGTTLQWDAYLVLHPGQSDHQIFVVGNLPDCRNFTEAIEAYYLAYPQWFRPVPGADPRIYGEGGYIWSSGKMRDLQLEEARRIHLDWEWVYAPFQRAGAIMPDATTWNSESGFNVEETQAVYDEKGGLEAWTKYNKERIATGDRTSAMFYYYLQQYSDVDLLKKYYSDSFWLNKEGKVWPPIFGWIKSGLWIQFSWPGKTLYGKRLRQDLAKAWETFDIAGFALDCAIGDFPYYGDALPRETGKAFEKDGQVFIEEGIALAQNIDFTHQLPARPDGRKAASIVNESATYLPMFHADALMHEKPPYERADLLPIRRYLMGQKPMYFWKGFRTDSLLDWENLSLPDFQRGMQGMVDYVILSGLRFGGVPAVFFVQGYAQVRDWIPRLTEVQRTGWRAATYASLIGDAKGTDEPAHSLTAKIWVSRFGDASESLFTVSSPKSKRQPVSLEIETARFGAEGALYLDMVTNTATNRIAPATTVADLVLENHQPVILEKVAELTSLEPVDVTLVRSFQKDQGGQLLVHCEKGWPADTKIRFSGEKDWRDCPVGEKVVAKEIPATFHLLPKENWVDQMTLGTEKQAMSVILILPKDHEELETRLIQLSHYWEYYLLRKAYPAGRLSALESKRNPELAFPVVDSLEAPELKAAKTIFVMGDGARRLVAEKFSGESKTPDAIISAQENNSRWVSVQPRVRSEALLWGDFLTLLDRRFPYIGALEYAPVFNKHKMSGTVFEGVKADATTESAPTKE